MIKKVKNKKKSVKKYKPDFVTLYTDASWDSKASHGSYAFWAKHQSGRLQMSKVLPKDIIDIYQGELYAICQGMHKALAKFPNVKGFYIMSDSLGAIGWLDNKAKKTRGAESLEKPGPEMTTAKKVAHRLYASYRKMVDSRELTIHLKHVRSHKNSNHSVSNWLNNWCDKEANKTRKELAKSKEKSSKN